MYVGIWKNEAEKIAYVNKAEEVALEDRELVRSELVWVAEWLKKRYPTITIREANRFLHEMLDVSV